MRLEPGTFLVTEDMWREWKASDDPRAAIDASTLRDKAQQDHNEGTRTPLGAVQTHHCS
jgi:hypothetical protein